MKPIPSPVRLAPDVEAWLRAGAGGGTPCERVIETSISWVFLFPDRALKLKKPVDLGFLDFTTPERRRWATERELAFNRPAAPEIYRRILPIFRDARGGIGFGGAGDPVEWALEMRRFDETATLADRPGAIDPAFAEALGRRIARYHLQASPGRVGGGAAGLRYVLDSNAHLLRGEAPELGAETVERLLEATDRRFDAVAPLLDQRLTEGFVRCCHGDLHLGNILLEDGAPVLFDCIEFNDALREIDVLYDIAFLLMDLAFRGAAEAANRVLNGWLDEAARGLGGGHWRGLAALPLYQAVRAAVRAHVNALEGKAEVSRRYLAAAESYLAPAPPRLLAVGGLSGSGKTTLARAVAIGFGPAPGAVVLRSDEIRKRLWGAAPAERLPPEAYSAESGAAVYEHLYATAADCLRAGRTVIADAAFLRLHERDRIEAVSRAAGAPFLGVWLEAPPTVLRDRIEGRHGDASDADVSVLERQIVLDPGPLAWEREPSGVLPRAIASVQRRLGLSPGAGPR